MENKELELQELKRYNNKKTGSLIEELKAKDQEIYNLLLRNKKLKEELQNLRAKLLEEK